MFNARMSKNVARAVIYFEVMRKQNDIINKNCYKYSCQLFNFMHKRYDTLYFVLSVQHLYGTFIFFKNLSLNTTIVLTRGI